MRKIKKLFSLIMALCILSPNAFAFETVEGDTKTGYETELLEILGVMKNDNLNTELTRVDFIQMLSKVLFYGNDYTNIATKEKPFLDVDNYHYAAYNIERLLHIGILSGDGNGYLRIDDIITLDEAYVMMLKAAGYGSIVGNYGEYPGNYRKLAYELELDENIQSGTAVTKEVAAKLLVNLMNTPVMKVNISADVSYKKGGLFMEENMGIRLSKGILEAAGDFNITKTAVSEESVIIGDIVLENKFGEEINEFIGYNMEFYYIEDTEELIYAYPRKNNVLNLKCESITEYKSLTYSYYDENEHIKKANIDGGASLVINGTVSNNYLDLIPAYGDVRLIDNDNDKDYDIILISSYEPAWVNGVISDPMTICFENTISDGTTALNLEDYDDYTIIDENGLECDFDKIEQNTLISLEYYGNEKIIVYLCKGTKSGKIESVRDMGSYDEIVLNGEKYNMSKKAYIRNWDRSVGVYVTVYFDIRGNVNAVVQNLDDTWLYGFIINGKEFISDSTGLSAIRVKMLTQTGGVQNYFIENEKLIIDGVKTKVSSFASEFALNRVIKYKTKDSDIIAVDFPKDYSMTSESEIAFTNSDDIFLRRAAGEFVYRGTPQIFKKNTTTNELDGEVIPRNANVPVFCVPGVSEISTAPDKQFYVKKVSDIAGNTGGKLEGYNSDSEDYFCDAIVMFGADSEIKNEGTVPIMIKSVTEALNENGEVSYKITGYIQGTEYTYFSSELIEEDLTRVFSPGDVIKISCNSENMIAAYKIVYSKQGGGIVTNSNSNTNKYDEGNIERYALGYAKSIKNGVMYFKNMDDGYPEFHKLDMVKSVLIYDSEDKKNPVKTGSVKDIRTMDNFGQNMM